MLGGGDVEAAKGSVGIVATSATARLELDGEWVGSAAEHDVGVHEAERSEATYTSQSASRSDVDIVAVAHR